MSQTKKTNAQMLKSIKQFNKIARETRAKNLGWDSAADLILYLHEEITKGEADALYDENAYLGIKSKSTPTPHSGKTKAPKSGKSGSKPVVHVVDILDASGSMSGSKFTNAMRGINHGVKELKESKEPIKYTYTLCDFADDIVFKEVMSAVDYLGMLKGNTRGSTALFDAIGLTITKVKASGWKKGDKVLVNIYTDGGENASRKFTASQINELIKEMSDLGWTFTFIGTEQDVKYASSILSIKESNTLVYDGSADGLEKSFTATSASRGAYFSKVSAGEDVSEGFYKDIK